MAARRALFSLANQPAIAPQLSRSVLQILPSGQGPSKRLPSAPRKHYSELSFRYDKLVLPRAFALYWATLRLRLTKPPVMVATDNRLPRLRSAAIHHAGRRCAEAGSARKAAAAASGAVRNSGRANVNGLFGSTPLYRSACSRGRSPPTLYALRAAAEGFCSTRRRRGGEQCSSQHVVVDLSRGQVVLARRLSLFFFLFFFFFTRTISQRDREGGRLHGAERAIYRICE